MSLRNSFIVLFLLSLATLGIGCGGEKKSPAQELNEAFNNPRPEDFHATLCVTTSPGVVTQKELRLPVQATGGVTLQFEDEGEKFNRKTVFTSVERVQNRFCTLVLAQTQSSNYAPKVILDATAHPAVQKVELCSWYAAAVPTTKDEGGNAHRAPCTTIEQAIREDGRKFGVKLALVEDDPSSTYPVVRVGRRKANDPIIFY